MNYVGVDKESENLKKAFITLVLNIVFKHPPMEKSLSYYKLVGENMKLPSNF